MNLVARLYVLTILSLVSSFGSVQGQQASIVFSDGGGVGKSECWHPVTGSLSYAVSVDVSPGRCGDGKYEIQWGDGAVTPVTRTQTRYSRSYNLASFRANVAAGVQTYNIFLASTDPDCFDFAVVRVTITKIPVPVLTVTAACENVESTFTNASHGRNRTGLQWRWDFSDGESLPGTANPLRRKFEDPDQTYSVTLSVKSEACGPSDFVSTAPVSFRLKKLPTTQAEVQGLGEGTLCYTDDSDSTIVLDASASTDANRFNWIITGGKYKVEELMKADSSVMRIKMLESAGYQVSLTARNECGAAQGPDATFTTVFESMPLPDINLIPQPDGCEELDFRVVNGKEGAVYTLFSESGAKVLQPNELTKLTVSEQPFVIEGVVTNICGTKMDSDTFYVHPKAPVEITSIPQDTTICIGTPSLALEASRQGGQWASDALQSIGGRPMFYPNAVGDFEVTYQVGTGLCLSANTRRVSVIDHLAQASIGLDETDLRCSPARVLFSNRSSGHEPDFSIWSFQNEGEVQTSADTISHVFRAGEQEATFLVGLKVRNACGVAEATRSIKVLPSTIKPLFNFPSGVFCPDVAIQFEDATVPAPIHWNWDFGDGGKSNIASPEHRFTKEGTYAVTLEAGNQCATSKVTHEINIQIPPKPQFVLGGDRACEGEEIAFVNNSDSKYAFEWDFGDGSPFESNRFSPVHTYSTEGNYQVKLTIFDGSRECQASAELPLTVASVLQASFSVEVEEGACEPALVKFVNNTAGADTWSWEFSDGVNTRTSQVKEPFIPFTRGQYTFQLVASRSGACPAEASESAYFDFTTCAVEIPEAFTPNNDMHGDRYTLFGDGIDRILFMRIRNRWGEIVYEMKDVPPGSQNPGESWDGTRNGRPLPADMYVFEAKVRYRDQSESEVIKGNFYLVR